MVRVQPNPVAYRCLVSYTMDRPGLVDCAVYDACGKRVTTLASGYEAAGEHSTPWNAPVPPGLYFVKLDTPDGTRTVLVARTR